MTCDECRPALDRLMDGELAEAESLRAIRHAGACEACARELELLERERQSLRQYARAAEPSPRLAPAFREALALEASRRRQTRASRAWVCVRALAGALAPDRPRPALALALVAVLAAGGALVALRGATAPSPAVADEGPAAAAPPDDAGAHDRTVPAPPASRAAGPESARAVRTRPGPAPRPRPLRARAAPETVAIDPDVAAAERRYQAAAESLARDLERRRAGLDAGAAARLAADLGELDRVIARSRSAVRTDPTDAEAVRYMTDAYMAKITLLRRVAAD